jgi:PhzF family phenazine biosynthesis protein
MSQKIIQIDAFSDKPFGGNPAAVCIMKQPADETWMQNVAAEMNLSETAFLYPIETGYHLRWFTPAAEVKLCGHATLASAHLLYEDGHVPTDQTIRFHTLSGELKASKRDEWIELDFPAIEVNQTEPPQTLIDALGFTPLYTGKGDTDYLVQLESEAAVRSLAPDFGAISRLDARGLIVTAEAVTAELDFVSRCFFPAYGIDEDPVTGSAHCALATFWSKQLNKNEFLASQASARGGYMKVRLEGDRVLLGGQAVTVMRGELI